MKALFLIVPDGFRDEEYSVPKKIFEENDIEVVTASTVSGKLTGKRGLTMATVNLLLAKVRAKDYSAVIVVGGQETFWNNPEIISLLREMHAADKVIGAICSSAVLPAQAGLLQGQPSTTFPSQAALAELKKYGAIYTAQPVTVAGKVVTAAGAEAAADFACQLVSLLRA